MAHISLGQLHFTARMSFRVPAAIVKCHQGAVELLARDLAALRKI